MLSQKSREILKSSKRMIALKSPVAAVAAIDDERESDEAGLLLRIVCKFRLAEARYI